MDESVGVHLDFDSRSTGISSDEKPVVTAPPKYSDDALALEFAEKHATSTRFVHPWSQWLHYEAGCWKRDRKKGFFDMSRTICREASDQYLTTEPKPSESVAKQLTSAKTVAAVASMASADPRIAATTEQWDCDRFLLNTPDGSVDLKTGRLQSHRSQDYLTKLTAVGPAEEAVCPNFARFLDRVTGSDYHIIRYLQRIFGYCLTGETLEHALFFVYGTGANGKTTLVNTLLGMLGDYGSISPSETFTETHSGNDRHPTELAKLQGARLVVASEVESRARWAEAKLKNLSGGDRITARFMRADFFEYVPQFKILISGNHKPTIRSVDEAMRRRLHLIPFNVTINEADRDTNLPLKLKSEWPGILRWAIDGCLEWQRQGLNPPKIVSDATEEYLASQDAIGRWLNECCVVSPQIGATKASHLYESWKQWADKGNEFVMSMVKFGDELSSRGFSKRTSNGILYEGLGLRSS